MNERENGKTGDNMSLTLAFFISSTLVEWNEEGKKTGKKAERILI